jgi:hypothetical protein
MPRKARKGKPALPADELPSQAGEPVTVRYTPRPPRGSPDKAIHRRRKVPPVPKGAEIPDASPSPPTRIESPEKNRP